MLPTSICIQLFIGSSASRKSYVELCGESELMHITFPDTLVGFSKRCNKSKSIEEDKGEA